MVFLKKVYGLGKSEVDLGEVKLDRSKTKTRRKSKTARSRLYGGFSICGIAVLI
jgi:hypothetical protein